MTFDIIEIESTLIVRIEGKLDASTAPELDKALIDKMSNIARVEFDLEGLDYISSAGLRTLLATYKRMMKMNGSMRLVNVNDSVMNVLELSGFADIYEIG